MNEDEGMKKTLYPSDVSLHPGAAASPAVASAEAKVKAESAGGGTWRMVLAMLLSGTIGLLVVESGLPVQLVVWLRCLLGGLGLAAYLAWSGLWLRPARSEWLWVLVGGAALVINWLCLFSAYHYSSIAVSTVVYHVQPFLLLLLAALFQGERLALRRLSWLVLALLGVVLSSGLTVNAGAQSQSQAQWLGVGLALLAALLYAVATLATQRLKRIAPAQIALLQMIVGVLVLAWPAWQALGQAQFSIKAWGAVLTLGLVHTAWMYTLMYAAFQRLPAQSIAGLSFIYPVVALWVDVLWFGTRPQLAQWLGMALILAAVWAYRRSHS